MGESLDFRGRPSIMLMPQGIWRRHLEIVNKETESLFTVQRRNEVERFFEKLDRVTDLVRIRAFSKPGHLSLLECVIIVEYSNLVIEI